MIDLKKYKITYLATPYTLYPAGIDRAFIDASIITAELKKAGIGNFVYSPIAHTHPIAILGEIDPLDKGWYSYNDFMLEASDALLVAKMLSWEKSSGVAYEIDFFRKAKKPYFFLDIDTMEITDGTASHTENQASHAKIACNRSVRVEHNHDP